MKTTVTLPFVRETKGTVVYALADVTTAAVGQLYVRKEHLEQVDGRWPLEITVTVEAGS